jgi:histidyl-tRNA synthetase
MTDLIQPRVLKGFRDYLPELMIPRERLLDQCRRVYRSYGYVPIDTPALEYTDILLGKAGEESDKLIYRFTDHGGRDVALRFDLTVPFARFAATHIGQVGTPFKRYHAGPVWRGENTAHGRFREFWQCDFDFIGTTANAADIEIALVIYDLMQVIGFERFRIHINNRAILNGLFTSWGLAGMAAAAVLRALDKLLKIGRDDVEREMIDKGGVSAEQARTILDVAELAGPCSDVLGKLERDYSRGNATTEEGVQRVRELFDVARAAGVSEEHLQLDLSIARGLDYYTGTVYETFLSELPGIGSVCSGGRYDNLAGLYTKQSLPGVGASLGLDRLLAAMDELGILQKKGTAAAALLVQFTADRLGEYEATARALRNEGIAVELYPEPKRVGQQLQYAERRGFAVALIAGPDEFAQGVWKVKDLARRQEVTVRPDELGATIASILSLEQPASVLGNRDGSQQSLRSGI